MKNFKRSETFKPRYSSEDLIYGVWPVREALESGPVAKVFLALGSDKKKFDEIIQLARKKNVPFRWVDRRQINQMASGHHQGVVAQVSPLTPEPYIDVLDLIKAHKGPGPGAVFLDGIQDPQNVGSILRSAVFFGVPAVVIPKWRAAPLTDSVVRASAGAARLIKISMVTNLAEAMEKAREKGIWLVGADMEGEDVKKAQVPAPFALIMGSEGSGLHQLIRKKCDIIVGIQRAGSRIDSLNVGAACAVLLHQWS